MTRIKKVMGLADVFGFGEFSGMQVKEAIERNPRQMLKMKNLGYFKLEEEAFNHLKEELL